jgi:hypothetical protein
LDIPQSQQKQWSFAAKKLNWKTSFRKHNEAVNQRLHQGLVTVPFWEYWTSPEKVAMALTIYPMVG